MSDLLICHLCVSWPRLPGLTLQSASICLGQTVQYWARPLGSLQFPSKHNLRRTLPALPGSATCDGDDRGDLARGDPPQIFFTPVREPGQGSVTTTSTHPISSSGKHQATLYFSNKLSKRAKHDDVVVSSTTEDGELTCLEATSLPLSLSTSLPLCLSHCLPSLQCRVCISASLPSLDVNPLTNC